eukprot:gene26194-53442_t
MLHVPVVAAAAAQSLSPPPAAGALAALTPAAPPAPQQRQQQAARHGGAAAHLDAAATRGLAGEGAGPAPITARAPRTSSDGREQRPQQRQHVDGIAGSAAAAAQQDGGK